jgi:hypothetical protein
VVNDPQMVLAQMPRLSAFKRGKRTIAMTKKFKTVSGYLRSMETDLCYQQQMAKLNGRPAISDDEGQRQIINNLLQQLGIGGQIEQAEKPHDAIRRLRQSTPV